MTDPRTAVPWRTGRRVGRTIYAQFGDVPGENDPLIGVMDTPELAAEAVDSHNSYISPYAASAVPVRANAAPSAAAGEPGEGSE